MKHTVKRPSPIAVPKEGPVKESNVPSISLTGKFPTEPRWPPS